MEVSSSLSSRMLWSQFLPWRELVAFYLPYRNSLAIPFLSAVRVAHGGSGECRGPLGGMALDFKSLPSQPAALCPLRSC